jgi:hypothetical protein
VGPGVSTTGPISGTAGFFSSNVGLGRTPGVALDVSGTIRAQRFLTIGATSNAEGGQLILNYAGIENIAENASSWNIDVTASNNLRFFRRNASNVALETMLMNENGNIGLGTNTPVRLLDVSGSINLPAQDVTATTNNMIYQADSPFIHTFRATGTNGANFFAGPFAGNTTISISGSDAFSASENTGVGRRALSSLTTGYGNTAVGRSALWQNTSGYNNTAVGTSALPANTSGFSNAAFGHSALLLNTTGYNNTASGFVALQQNTTGYNNTASGMQALVANTTGYNNTASGLAALFVNTTGFNNVAFGRESLRNNLEGFSNTGLGAVALFDVSGTASNNTAVGANTGRGIVSGNNNTILGANVAGLPNNLANTVIVADGSGNRRIYIDNTGFVGINLASGTMPTAMLNVSGSANISGTVRATAFVGDGSGLTGLPGGTPDRIVSGSVSAIATSALGQIVVSGTVSATSFVAARSAAATVCAAAADEGRLYRNSTTGRLQLCALR